MRHRPDIDGLRALAVVPVILFHAGFETFSGGFVGVDIFFVISGYLITSVISEEIHTNSFSLRKFYERRARRILPALLLICLVCVPLALVWMSPPDYRSFSNGLMAVALFSSNILFWRTSDYFGPDTDLNPLVHTWSLAVEEQFYVLFPLLLILIRRMSRNAQVAIIALATAASLGLAIHASRVEPSFNFYLIPTRAWELGVGSLLALMPIVGRTDDRRLSMVANFVGLGLIAYAIFYFDDGTPFPSQYALLPVLGTALLIVCGNSNDAVGNLLRLPFIVGIGLISYSLYLWHQPILAFLKIRSLYAPSMFDITGAIALTVLLSILTWKFVESPFRRRDQIGTKALIASAVAASILIMSVGLAGHLTKGFGEVTAARAQAAALSERLRKTRGLSPACDHRFTLADQCRTSDDPEILVWGDSYAMHLIAGLAASRPDVRLVQMTKSMCGPILGVATTSAQYPEALSKRCLEFNERVMGWVKSNPGVKYAVLSSTFDQYTDSNGRYHTVNGIIDADPQYALERLSWTLDELRRHGVVPVVVSPPPSFGGDIAKCLATADKLGLHGNPCDFPRADYHKTKANTIRFLQAIGKNHKVIWLSDVMCDELWCKATSGDTMLYADAGHLTREGSIRVAAKLRLYEQVTERSAVLQTAQR